MFSRLPWRLARLVVLGLLVFVLMGVFVQQSQGNYPTIFYQLADYLHIQLPQSINEPNRDFSLSKEVLVKQIEILRQKNNLESLDENPKLNQAAELVLEKLIKTKSPGIDSNLLDNVYKQVGFSDYESTTSNFVTGPEFMFATPSSWLTERIIKEDMKDKNFSQFGLAYKKVSGQSKFIPNQYALVFIMAKVNLGEKQKPKKTKPISSNWPRLSSRQKQRDVAYNLRPTPTPLKFPDISDTEVINALNLYRADHKIHQLVVDQNLCEYAQKRVQDLLKHGGLDNHAGFKQDFDVKDYNQLPEPIKRYSGGAIGENLAYQYCRNMKTGESFIAQTGTALIEWCFDSSTKGHREAQLNPRYNAVCVRHANGYYVVIFGE